MWTFEDFVKEYNKSKLGKNITYAIKRTDQRFSGDEEKIVKFLRGQFKAKRAVFVQKHDSTLHSDINKFAYMVQKT